MVQKQKVTSDNFTILQESQKTEYLSCINENCCYFGLCLCEILVLCMANSSIYYYSNSLSLIINKMSKNCTYNFLYFTYDLLHTSFEWRHVDAKRQKVIGTLITFCLPASTFSPCEPMMEKRYKCILITFRPWVCVVTTVHAEIQKVISGAVLPKITTTDK